MQPDNGGQAPRGAESYGCRSAGRVAERGQQPFEIFAARPARPQVGRDAGIAFFRWFARGDQFGIDMEHFHRLGAAHISRIGPQEAIQFIPDRNHGMFTPPLAD